MARERQQNNRTLANGHRQKIRYLLQATAGTSYDVVCSDDAAAAPADRLSDTYLSIK